MADIELVIKIPEEIRLALINDIKLSPDQQSICDSYIKHAIITGKVDVLNDIRAEIEQIANEEQKNDEKWAIGLRYAVKIIDKYREE